MFNTCFLILSILYCDITLCVILELAYQWLWLHPHHFVASGNVMQNKE